MTSNGIHVNCRWGGNIVRDDNGLLYEGGECHAFFLTPTTTYKGLLAYVRRVIGLNPRLHKVGLICSHLVYEDSKWTYQRLRVNTDEAVSLMYCSGLQNQRQGSVELYVAFANRDDTTAVQPAPIDPVSSSNPVDTQNEGSRYEHPRQVLHPNPVYNFSSLQPIIDTSYGTATMLGSSSFQPSANTSFLPYGSGICEGEGSGGQYAEHYQEEYEIQTQQPSSADIGNDLTMQIHTDEVAESLVSLTLDQTDESDEEEEVAVDDVNDEDDEDHFEVPSAYFRDIRGFAEPAQWEPSDMVRASDYDPTTQELRKGLVFDDKKSLQDAVGRYHIRNSFQLKVLGSNKSMWEVRCKHASKEKCAWRLRGSKQKHERWEIVTYNGAHTCLLREFNKHHPQLTAAFVSREIIHFIRVDPAYKIVTIRAGIEKEFNTNVSYYKAWYAKQIAIAECFGDWDMSYADLPRFLLAVQQNNPGTIVAWHTRPAPTSGQVMFDRVFWAFKPSIDGFSYCRPIVSIDATFLYGKYSGNILIAMSKDAADKLFPLAFAFVEKENLSNWAWFLRLLRQHVARERMDLCIIADRHQGILAAINNDANGWGPTFKVHHRFCLRHVQANFYKQFPDTTLKKLIWDAGSQTSVTEFDAKMKLLKEKDPSDRKLAWKWVNDLPVEKWTLAHDGGYRHGELTTNISESFNGVLKSARFLPITACAQVIFFRLVDLWLKNRTDAAKAISEGDTITPHGKLLITSLQLKQAKNRCRVFNRESGEGIVNSGPNIEHIVHITQRRCSCGWWDAYHFPCHHALTILHELKRSMNLILPNWCSMETYADTWRSEFHPVLNRNYWQPWTGDVWTPNPELLRGRGRRKESRFENEMDRPTNPKEVRCCRSCGKEGHNTRTCPTKVDQRPMTMHFAHGFQDY